MAHTPACIAAAEKRLTEDAKVFGKDAWIYCGQHLRPHKTGWCTVDVQMDKLGLGPLPGDHREQQRLAYAKCRSLGLCLYQEKNVEIGNIYEEVLPKPKKDARKKRASVKKQPRKVIVEAPDNPRDPRDRDEHGHWRVKNQNTGRVTMIRDDQLKGRRWKLVRRGGRFSR